jgi:ribosome-binding factor A
MNGFNVSRRTEKVASLIRTVIAEAIQTRLADPRIPTITSITRVVVSDDFSVARIFVSVMAPEAQRNLCLTALRSAATMLRRILAPELQLRKIPLLVFELDESLRKGLETLEVIDAAMRELGEVPAWEAEDAAEDETEEELLTDDPSADALRDDPLGASSPPRPPQTEQATQEDA